MKEYKVVVLQYIVGKGFLGWTHPENTDVRAENSILRLNVKELQEQLNEAQKRIVALFDHSGASDGAIKVLHKEMREQGYDPTDEDDVEKYWDDVREN